MFTKNKITGSALLILMIALAGTGCQKEERPALGDYPKDSNPPGGPLKFYAAYENTSVDSIRANFGSETNTTFTQGITGMAIQGGANGYVVYPSANDFKKSTSMTVAFWLKKNGPNPAGGGTSFVFGLSTTKDIWTRMDMFLEFEDAGNPSSADLASAKFYLRDQWFEFTGAKRIPNILNNQWHHIAFSFDASTSMLTTYVDGAELTGLPAGFGKFNNDGGKPDFSQSAGIVVGGPGHFAVGKTPDGWMGNFGGAIDQFRLYGVALSAAEVKSLFDSKK
ncbi:LamG domain-containing protein [Terrimonas sp. NA20]|uniref:LamG domain-containing protein n=1 Tax=Terrimonas ginsenosidimutans TaxID=2908004 RepID=A0ABS9KV06_9BACT|nr:LamG domain-containing protein [Terrimonas ginsenosidimutans]MCG2616123.1 LamG domain-containing protein [Terrimonas ginsenosidimutans]